MFYSASSNPTHVYNTSGTFNVILVSQNNTGCVDTATAIINVYNVPDAAFTHNFLGEDYILDESTLQLNNNTPNGNHYLWTFDTGDTSNFYEPQYVYHNPGYFTIQLFAYSAQGCVDVAQQPIHVRVRESFYIPNAFTPNGNDVNDYFSIKDENLAGLKIIIFNRWGEVIYTSGDKNFKWDGTYNGNPVKQGIYGYILTTTNQNGDEQTTNGTLTLVK